MESVSIFSLLGLVSLSKALMSSCSSFQELPVGDMTNFWSKRDGTKKE